MPSAQAHSNSLSADRRSDCRLPMPYQSRSAAPAGKSRCQSRRRRLQHVDWRSQSGEIASRQFHHAVACRGRRGPCATSRRLATTPLPVDGARCRPRGSAHGRRKAAWSNCPRHAEGLSAPREARPRSAIADRLRRELTPTSFCALMRRVADARRLPAASAMQQQITSVDIA